MSSVGSASSAASDSLNRAKLHLALTCACHGERSAESFIALWREIPCVARRDYPASRSEPYSTC